jgi:hypothetical protein
MDNRPRSYYSHFVMFSPAGTNCKPWLHQRPATMTPRVSEDPSDDRSTRLVPRPADGIARRATHGITACKLSGCLHHLIPCCCRSASSAQTVDWSTCQGHKLETPALAYYSLLVRTSLRPSRCGEPAEGC